MGLTKIKSGLFVG